MDISFDGRILVALYNAAVEKGVSGGFRISELMPEGCTLLDARMAATRLLSEGYIEIPQEMSAAPIVYFTEKGCKRVQELLMM